MRPKPFRTSFVERLDRRVLLAAVDSTVFSYSNTDQHIDVALTAPVAGGLTAPQFTLQNLTQDTTIPTQ